MSVERERVDDAPEPEPFDHSPSRGAALSNWLVGAATGFLGKRTSRRGFLVSSAMVGSAVAVAGCSYAGRPGGAYDRISDCPPGALCRDGYTEFCCSINNGKNECPPGSIPAGWWRADYSDYCHGTRYYIDCNQTCCGPVRSDGFCQGCTECRCGPTCNNRKVYCNYFRYGQCNSQVAHMGPIACRVTTCVPPYRVYSSCGASSAVDNSTANHLTKCLFYGGPSGPILTPVPVLVSLGSAVVPAPGTATVFVRQSNEQIAYRDFDGATWLPWATLDGIALSKVVSTIATTGDTLLTVKGYTRGMHVRRRVAGVWDTDWLSLGGEFYSDPAVANDGTTNYIFGRGHDDKIWQSRSSDGLNWSGWTSIGGEATSDPVAVRFGSTVLVFVRGADGAFYVQRFSGGNGSSWKSLGSLFTSDPEVVANGSEVLVFGRGSNNATLFNRSTDGVNWQGFYPLGGVATSEPAAVLDGSDLFVFVRGSDNKIAYESRIGGTWTAWSSLEGGPTADLAAVSPAPGTIFLFARFGDNALWYRQSSGGTWGAWTSLGGTVASIKGYG